MGDYRHHRPSGATLARRHAFNPRNRSPHSRFHALHRLLPRQQLSGQHLRRDAGQPAPAWLGRDRHRKFGHDPRYPVTDNWPHLVQQLADFAAAQKKADQGQAPILLGHSLGGILSLMCAAQRPELARAVVMLDSPVLGGWRASAVHVVKRTALMQRLSPAQISRRRRDQWDDREAVYQHFAGKKCLPAGTRRCCTTT
jgi:pimeloyl-ACP methyl ester carboxylesterase